MPLDPRVIGYLHRALNHELNMVQHYLTQSCLCEFWGEQAAAQHFRRDANEEQDHAAELIRRMLALGLVPNGSQLNAVRPGRDMDEMLLIDRRLEADAVRLYDEAARYCSRHGDQASAVLFTRLLQDESGHLEVLDQAIAAARTERQHG